MNAPEQYDRIAHADINRIGRWLVVSWLLAVSMGAALGWAASAVHSLWAVEVETEQ